MTSIRLSNISKKYQDILAVEDVSFSLGSGECLALIGPSGAGKTTLLRLLAGLEEPTEGEIYFDEVYVKDLPIKERQVGMMFQTPLLFPHVKIRRNITYGMDKLGFSKEETEAKLEEVATQLKIASLLDRTPEALSGGERQRVEMARALVRDTKVLLLDEPFANLDIRLKEELQKEIKEIQKERGITMILSTHDQEEAMFFGDWIGILDHGRLMAFERALTLYENPSNVFAASFFGKPRMNFVDGKVHIVKGKMALELLGKQIPLERGLPEQEVLVGIRPNYIQFHPVGEFSGVIEEIQHVNAQYLYRVKCEEELLEIDANAPMKIGELVYFDIDMEHMLFFDRNGERIELR